MGILEANQLFVPESAAEIRDDMLTDFRLEARKYSVVEPSVAPGTDNWIFFTAVANAGLLQYANIAVIRPSITPLTAVGDDLENWRIALGLPVVQASPSVGKITVTVTGSGTVTIPDGLQFVLPNGLRGKVSGTQMGIADGSDVNVITIDTGTATKADAGTIVRFSNPPFNVATEARVSVNAPLTGGLDTETEARKRARILNRLGNTPGGGNWGHLRELAFDALATVQYCYVYPALGGPASAKVTIVRDFDTDRNDFSRAFSSAAIAIVRDAIHAAVPSPMEIVVGTTADEASDVAIKLDLPDSSLAGGNGLGWLDQAPWPPASSGATVPVTSATSSVTFTVNAATATAPIAGLTHIAWWSSNDMKFRVGLVTNVTGSTGAWVLTVDRPMVDDTGAMIGTGDFISPAAANLDAYGATFIDLMRTLGAGENTASAGALPRARRHPFIGDSSEEIEITGQFLAKFLRAHSEIVDGDFSSLPNPTPDVPASVDDDPHVLVPRHFGIYVMP